jgi:hypothetical protein
MICVGCHENNSENKSQKDEGPYGELGLKYYFAVYVI